MNPRFLLGRVVPAALLLAVVATAATLAARPPVQAGDLHFVVENRSNANHTIEARSSGPGITTEIEPHRIVPRSHDTTIIPFVETWSVRIDGGLVLSSVDRPDLAVAPGVETDLIVTIVITDAGVELGPVRFAPSSVNP